MLEEGLRSNNGPNNKIVLQDLTKFWNVEVKVYHSPHTKKYTFFRIKTNYWLATIYTVAFEAH